MRRSHLTTTGLVRCGTQALCMLSMAIALGACPEDCPKGKKDCACNEGKCDDGLSCKDDKCVAPAPACPAGREGCPCLPGNTCNAVDGGSLECQSNVCVAVAACPVGTQGCPCDNGACQDPLRCASNVCEPVTLEDGITVGAAGVRACDLLFAVGSTGASQVVFDASVVGKFRLEAGRMAVSFTARQDAALSGPVAQVQNPTGTAVDLSAVTPSVVHCFDRLGAAVADPMLVLR